MRISVIDKILNRCIENIDGCLLYPTSASSIWVDGKMLSLSTIIYEYYIGQLPYRNRIDRTCNNGKCLNPLHMLSLTPEDKFWRRVDIEANEICWNWLGAVDGGNYGIFRSSIFSEIKTHRISWYLTYGKIPQDMWVLHKCDNPICCNPQHLFLGNNQDNINDKVLKNRQSRLFGERNGRSKLTIRDIKEIRKLHINGYSYRDITSVFPISFTQTARIIRGESWSWVN